MTFDAGEVHFTDANGDGFADGAGTSDASDAWISQINDVEQSRDQVRDRGFEAEGCSFHLSAEQNDCTVPVIWDVAACAQVSTASPTTKPPSLRPRPPRSGPLCCPTS